jgi:hypothetical protein
MLHLGLLVKFILWNIITWHIAMLLIMVIIISIIMVIIISIIMVIIVIVIFIVGTNSSKYTKLVLSPPFTNVISLGQIIITRC